MILLLALVLAAIVVARSAGAIPPAQPAVSAPAGQVPPAFDLASAGRLSSRFNPDGATLSIGHRNLMTLGLASIGRGAAMRAVPDTKLSFGHQHTASYDSVGLRQSYVREGGGLEQVFTIARRPTGTGGLRLVVGRVSAGIRARLSGRNVTLLDRGGRALARYGGLRVTDASGKVVGAQIRVDGSRLLLVIDDRSVRYPLRVDPYVQIAKLTPSSFDVSLGNGNGDRSAYGPSDTFGTAIAESANGEVLVVGDPLDDSAFVFVKPPHGGWQDAHPTARLETDVQAQYPELGDAVAVSSDGKTIVVGEPHTTDAGVQTAGEALVYTEPSDGWSHASGHQKAILAPADPTDFGNFGAAVAIDGNGDTVVVGAPGYNNEEGGAYLFRRGASGWSSTTSDVDAVVGEPGSSSDYGGEFGLTVSMSSSGDVIVVGAPGASNWEGALYVFGHDLQGYRELADSASGTSDGYFICSGGGGYGIFNPELGSSVAVSADGKTIVAGEPCAGRSGSAFIYDEPKHGWSTASGGISGGVSPLRPDIFYSQAIGSIVAIAGNASAIVADDPAFERTGGYVATFRRPTKGWTHVNPPVADNFGSVLTPSGLAHGLYFDAQGTPLALSSGGGNLFVGDTGTNNDGAVYVYELASDIASATTVSCSPSSLDTGKSATCTATVTTKSPTATGQVAFRSTGASAASFSHSHCTLNRIKTGTATCHVSFTPHQRMSYTVTARYGGDNNHGSGTGTTVVDTPRNGTTTQVSCSPNPVTAASQTVCTATVTGFGAHLPTVTFKTVPAVPNAPSSGACVEQLQGGTESCTMALAIATSGTYAVTAAYAGDSIDAPSVGLTHLVVADAMTSTSAGCSPGSIYDDQTTACTATVSGIVGTGTPPAIIWTANGTGWSFTGQSCVAGSPGTETCTATFNPGLAGMARLSAEFPGNASNLGSVAEVAVTVESTVVLSCAGTDAWICTTTVTDRRNLPITPTGTITLTGGVTGGSSSNLGSCTLQATINPAASSCPIDVNPHGSSSTFTLTASYPGDGIQPAGSDTIEYKDPA